jgi:hypothetical protein
VEEFWNMCALPTDHNGLGISVSGTERQARWLERYFTLVPDSALTYGTWRRLVAVHNILGVKVHHAWLVATMRVHGVSRILTFNAGDFSRYTASSVSICRAKLSQRQVARKPILRRRQLRRFSGASESRWRINSTSARSDSRLSASLRSAAAVSGLFGNCFFIACLLKDINYGTIFFPAGRPFTPDDIVQTRGKQLLAADLV